MEQETRQFKSRSRDAFKERMKEKKKEEEREKRAKRAAKMEEAGKEKAETENKSADNERARKRSTRAGDGNAENESVESASAGSVKENTGNAGSRKKKFGFQAVLLSAAVVVALGIGFYVFQAQRYYQAYLPHTVVNGMNVAGKTPEEVKTLISGDVKDYSLRIGLRDGKAEEISGESIGLHTVFDGSLEEIISQQNPYAWPRYLLKGPSYDIQTMTDYDRQALLEVLAGFPCLDDSLVTLPANARLSDYIPGQGYTVIPEEEGNKLDRTKAEEAVLFAVDGLKTDIDLEQLGCYEEPSIRSDNEELAKARDARNYYVNEKITYRFGSTNEVLDGEKIHQWLVVAEDGTISLDEEAVAAYVAELAKTYDTAYRKRSFATSYGQTVEVSGFYGWRINQKEETAGLLEALNSGQDSVREPVYSQKAASHDGNDYGTTYAEVNLTAQHLFFYKDGEKILESDFISGNVAKRHTTPPGIFALTYKQRNAVLRGEGYAAPVKFWMPFNGGIGFHDASWRSTFGGSIYKTGGSHGCINMPYEAAKTLFENVYAGVPVICYNLAGTESAGPTKASGKPVQAAGGAPAQAQQPAQTPGTPAQTPAATEAQAENPAGPAPSQSPGIVQESRPAGPGETTTAESRPAGPGETAAPETPAAPETTASGQVQPDVSIRPVSPDSSGPGGGGEDYGPGV